MSNRSPSRCSYHDLVCESYCISCWHQSIKLYYKKFLFAGWCTADCIQIWWHRFTLCFCHIQWVGCQQESVSHNIRVLTLQADAELTAVRFDDTGLHCAVGTSNGLVALYDLRSSRPLLIKNHMYGDKIIDIKFHSAYGSNGNAGKLLPLSPVSTLNHPFQQKTRHSACESSTMQVTYFSFS